MPCSVEDVPRTMSMGRILVITDDAERSTELAQDLAGDAPFALLDLYRKVPPIEPPAATVVNIFNLRSDTIARLRRLLDQLPPSGPLVMLLHKDAPRGRILAVALGAALTLCPPFDIPACGLASRPSSPSPTSNPYPPAPSRPPAKRATSSRPCSCRAGASIPSTISTGTDFVGQAIQETGIRDWVRAVRRFDDITHQHCLLVAGLAAAFARAWVSARWNATA